MSTKKQIEANRRNAKKSTGPRTEHGKEIVKRNSSRHGLSGAGIVLPQDEAAEINERVAMWNSSLKPINDFEVWLTEVIAVEAIRVDMGQRHDLVLRGMQVHRAQVCWDDDRRLQAEQLGARLAHEPGLISRQLRMTAQGAEWLLERWEGLARTLREGRDWSEAQRSLALDLLGEPAELRDGRTRVDGEGESGQSERERRLGIAQSEIDVLMEKQSGVLADLDDRERSAAELGLGTEVPAPLQLVRRYLTASLRRLAWAWGQFKTGRHAVIDPGSQPAYSPRKAPAVAVNPAPEPAAPSAPSRADMLRSVLEEHTRESGLSPMPTTAGPVDPSSIRIVPESPVPSREAREAVTCAAPNGVTLSRETREALAVAGFTGADLHRLRRPRG